ncbi:sirohydrochlorin chelatase [Variovorax saccharolyticus]|uniref:sirohydrochlorin chelatase n=1 Tax=Variovorax saccharolyticus TaxID=3053516 RepID=UPI0025768619|nr:CbiX/SirB N-terminal domain-containing protein [Variovorax sp. J22R187]MDM0017024.1 CbiX/SirB N-terminal domain-containing protein [Variovorax sp. J22R187]
MTVAAASALGIVLFAHGSRDERWREPVEAVARQVAALDPTARVACAYLELVAPDLRTAALALIAGGARRVRIVPLFLGMGRHVREDLPLLVEELRALRPDVVFSQQPAVGEDPEVIALLARKALDS